MVPGTRGTGNKRNKWLPVPWVPGTIFVLFLFTAASSQPDNIQYPDSQGPSVRVPDGSEEAFAEAYREADVVFSAYFDGMSAPRVGAGMIPVREVRVSFRDIRILKGPSIKGKSFRYPHAPPRLRIAKNKPLQVALKKDKGGDYRIIAML